MIIDVVLIMAQTFSGSDKELQVLVSIQTAPLDRRGSETSERDTL